MRAPRRLTSVAVVVLAALAVGGVVLVSSLLPAYAPNDPELLASGLDGAAGSAIGPDGDLYVVEPRAGELARVDRRTGAAQTVVTGLPARAPGSSGGAVDVAFLGPFAYVLTVDAGGLAALYRIGATGTVNRVADLGAWSRRHPPAAEHGVPAGAQDALEPYRGGFLVSDGHGGRVLHVAPGGAVEEVVRFDHDVVPTGLETAGRSLLVVQTEPHPHLPHDGRVVAVHPTTGATRPETGRVPMLVDVERGRDGLYVLAQDAPGSVGAASAPADPRTGQVLAVGPRGHLETVTDGIRRPTSLEVVGGTAYVVCADGTVHTVALGVS